MNIVEQNRNQYTKERTEVEAYLMRIIQRFFDIKNNETQESIEAMIVESLTRLKRDFYHLKTLIFHFNGKTGHISVGIEDVGGEKAFEKKTAFNKDFGTVVDTICEGNDPRLSDDRTPTQHVHIIDDIDILNLLNQSGGLVSTAHSHLNGSSLDVIRYTGTATSIDLIIIEHILENMDGYVETIRRDLLSIQSSKDVTFKPLNDIFDRIKGYLQEAQDLLTGVNDWLNAAKNYTDSRASQLEAYLNNLLLESELPAYMAAHDSVYLLSDGVIDLNDMSVFTETNYKITSKKYETQINHNIGFNVPINVPVGHKIAYVKCYIEYEKLETFISMNADGNLANTTQFTTRSAPLPMYYPNIREEEPFIIDYEFTDKQLKFTIRFFLFIDGRCVELCKVGNMIVLRTDGMTVQDMIEQSLHYIVSYLNVNAMSASEKNTFFAAINGYPDRDFQYLLDGKYGYVFDDNANIVEEAWLDSNGDKIENIDWDSDYDADIRIGSRLVLTDNNKITAIYTNITGIERSALLAVNPSAINGYIKNPRIRYQVYCRKE